MVAREQLNEAIGLLSTISNSPTAVTWVSDKLDQKFYLRVDNDMHLAGAHTATVEADRWQDDFYSSIMFENVINFSLSADALTWFR